MEQNEILNPHYRSLLIRPSAGHALRWAPRSARGAAHGGARTGPTGFGVRQSSGAFSWRDPSAWGRTIAKSKAPAPKAFGGRTPKRWRALRASILVTCHLSPVTDRKSTRLNSSHVS